MSTGDSTVTFLLVHGSWHGPWCWERLEPELTDLGHRSVAVALPSVGEDIARLGDFRADVAAVTEAAAAADGPIVVVAHSYGGAVVSGATFADDVARLVFLGAFMPDTGRSYVSYFPPGALPTYVGLRDDGTMVAADGEARHAFYLDCDDETVEWAIDRLRPQSQSVIGPEIGDASWRSTPSTYVVLGDDRALPPEMQRSFAAQADEVVEMATSHSPFLSRPRELAVVLNDIARRRA